ncbi:DNA-binding protein [Syncephalastrum racemosum]|uniref:DNA-binding protein n=1 Tax=Syncephalastrum racemosum TaxID=13706 RepID=A0A1X2H5F0_SYNRA|nr:DNA-binding protein [Syncephalastrum racemosum]
MPAPRRNAPNKAPAKKAPEGPTTIEDASVLKKYQDAAQIANSVLDKVIKMCVDGAKIIDVCVAGDKAIQEAIQAVHKDVKSKGVGFPTTVSKNNCVAHFSPIASDPEAEESLKNDDLVKIQLGAQIDGFCATVAHTLVVGASAEKPVTGEKADVIQAAHVALEAAVRQIRPGNKNMEVTKTVDDIATAYGTKAVEGMLTHQQLKNNTAGKKTIILNPSEAHLRDFERITFAENEVYAVDILVSSGEGKVRQLNTRTTIYKKTDTRYELKMATSRQVLSEIQKKAGNFPIALRDLSDLKKARMGVVECTKSQTLLPYDVVYEREGAYVAQFLTTLLVTKDGNIMATDPKFNQALVKSDKKVDNEEINKLLAEPLKA